MTGLAAIGTHWDWDDQFGNRYFLSFIIRFCASSLNIHKPELDEKK